VNGLYVSAQVNERGGFTVTTGCRFGSQATEYQHDTYPAMLDDELQTLMLCVLWECFQRALRYSQGLDYVLD